MAGRCGCSSSNATGASISAGACVTVSGAGTTASPAVIGVEVDPDASNNLQCGANGLFAGGTQVEVGEGLTISGDGSNATPYDIGIELDPDGDNLLSVGADGLLALARIAIEIDGAYIGGSPPADADFKVVFGLKGVTTDTNGNATITLPTAFPTGFGCAIPILGSVPTITVALVVDQTAVALNAFRINAKDASNNTNISGGNLLVAYVAVGW